VVEQLQERWTETLGKYTISESLNICRKGFRAQNRLKNAISFGRADHPTSRAWLQESWAPQDSEPGMSVLTRTNSNFSERPSFAVERVALIFSILPFDKVAVAFMWLAPSCEKISDYTHYIIFRFVFVVVSLDNLYWIVYIFLGPSVVTDGLKRLIVWKFIYQMINLPTEFSGVTLVYHQTSLECTYSYILRNQNF
jgi:hypothetical protein